jgi:3-oxoadipate enol-lactonase
MMTVVKVGAEGVEISFRVHASASSASGRPWLVLVHALGLDLGQWEPQIDKFGHAFDILRVDLRGHGGSGAPAGPYRLDQLADDLRGVLDALRIPRCHLVGSALGGLVGQTAALRFPLRIGSLTLVGSAGRTTPMQRRALEELCVRARAPQGMFSVEPTLLEYAYTPRLRARRADLVAMASRAIRAADPGGFVGCAQAMLQADLTARLPSISCPTLVVAAEQDPWMPVTLSEELVRLVPGARLRILPDAANLMNIEHPVAFNDILAAFLLDIH